MKRIRKKVRKDAYIGVRLPQHDVDRLEAALASERRGSKSDLAWALIIEGLDRREVAGERKVAS